MNERVRRLTGSRVRCWISVPAKVGTSGYHELIPRFSEIDVCSLDIGLDKRPTAIADIERGIPFADEVFRTCLAFNLFEHLYDIQKVLKDIWRVLSPGGYLFLAVPFLLRVHADPYYYFRYTEQSLQRSLEGARFVNIVIEPCGAGAATAALRRSIS
jgi:SAM-dependent methyltransferase